MCYGSLEGDQRTNHTLILTPYTNRITFSYVSLFRKQAIYDETTLSHSHLLKYSLSFPVSTTTKPRKHFHPFFLIGPSQAWTQNLEIQRKTTAASCVTSIFLSSKNIDSITQISDFLFNLHNTWTSKSLFSIESIYSFQLLIGIPIYCCARGRKVWKFLGVRA